MELKSKLKVDNIIKTKKYKKSFLIGKVININDTSVANLNDNEIQLLEYILK